MNIINKNYTYVFFILLLFFNNQISSKSVLDIQEDELILGEKNAPITIIEYASLSCSHCADFHKNTLPELKKEFIDTGKVKMIFRFFPFNLPALRAGMVLECLPSDIRYEYMSALYELQSKWVVKDSEKSNKELYKIMQSGGMKKEVFDKCINDVALEKKILQGLIDAQNELNIKSTPSFVVNGTLIQGNKPIKDFRQIIQKILSE